MCPIATDSPAISRIPPYLRPYRGNPFSYNFLAKKEGHGTNFCATIKTAKQQQYHRPIMPTPNGSTAIGSQSSLSSLKQPSYKKTTKPGRGGAINKWSSNNPDLPSSCYSVIQDSVVILVPGYQLQQANLLHLLTKPYQLGPTSCCFCWYIEFGWRSVSFTNWPHTMISGEPWRNYFRRRRRKRRIRRNMWVHHYLVLMVHFFFSRRSGSRLEGITWFFAKFSQSECLSSVCRTRRGWKYSHGNALHSKSK